jgi:hypothetical protein
VNATEHYQAAEKLLSEASYTTRYGVPVRPNGEPMLIQHHTLLVARAQVHATLALAAANGADDPALVEGLRNLVAEGVESL